MARFFFGFLVDGNLFEIVGFEYLTAIHAVHVVDPIPAHQEFSALMLAAWHSKLEYPYSNRGRHRVKPPLVLVVSPHLPAPIGESP